MSAMQLRSKARRRQGLPTPSSPPSSSSGSYVPSQSLSSSSSPPSSSSSLPLLSPAVGSPRISRPNITPGPWAAGCERYRLDFGRNKGKTLDECEVGYVRWLLRERRRFLASRYAGLHSALAAWERKADAASSPPRPSPRPHPRPTPAPPPRPPPPRNPSITPDVAEGAEGAGDAQDAQDAQDATRSASAAPRRPFWRFWSAAQHPPPDHGPVPVHPPEPLQVQQPVQPPREARPCARAQPQPPRPHQPLAQPLAPPPLNQLDLRTALGELAHFSTDLSARARAATHAHTSATAVELHTHIARTSTDMQRSLERQTSEIRALFARPQRPHDAPAPAQPPKATQQAQLHEAEERHRAREAHTRRIHELELRLSALQAQVTQHRDAVQEEQQHRKHRAHEQDVANLQRQLDLDRAQRQLDAAQHQRELEVGHLQRQLDAERAHRHQDALQHQVETERHQRAQENLETRLATGQRDHDYGTVLDMATRISALHAEDDKRKQERVVRDMEERMTRQRAGHVVQLQHLMAENALQRTLAEQQTKTHADATHFVLTAALKELAAAHSKSTYLESLSALDAQAQMLERSRLNQAVALSSRYASQTYKAMGDEGGEQVLSMLARNLSVGLENVRRGRAFSQQPHGQVLGEQGDHAWEQNEDPWEESSRAVR